MEKLVSIITPCYNGEKFVRRFLDSILNQTYKAIELIFINDGSIDGTEKIVMDYIPTFERQGMILIYEKQSNAGQAAALNQGLKLFTGEYLTWPDSDDYLDKTSIEKRVTFLENNLQYGFVRSNAYYVDSQTLKPIRRVTVSPRRFETNLFEGFLRNSQFCVNGCYLVKTSAFLDVNPTRTIEISSIGQNLQMLLSLSYKYSCGFIDEPLFYYVNTPNSHSRVRRTYYEASVRYNEYYRLLHSLCDKIEMSMDEKRYYDELLNKSSLEARRNLTIEYKCLKDFCQYQSQYHFLYPSPFDVFMPVYLKYYTKQIYYWIKITLKNTIKYIIK